VRIDGPPVLLEPTVAQAFAVALHELATNAAKYGSLSGDRGQVDLEWLHKADGQLIFRWMEMGGPVVQMPRRQGFGTRVIERMIGQLKGKVRLTGARRDSFAKSPFRREINLSRSTVLESGIGRATNRCHRRRQSLWGHSGRSQWINRPSSRFPAST
jgi:hypothetical protein